jgi:NADH-quinone oxidoreductase subunit D
VHVRDPSFVNLQALPEMSEGGLLADMIANIAMLDPILGGIDR